MRGPINKEQTPQDFAKEHWKEIVAVSGTLAGAVILLLIRYHKKRDKDNGIDEEDLHLAALEGEALGKKSDVPMFLDTGIAVKEHIPGSDAILTDLQKGLPKKSKVRRFMKTLRRVKN